MEIWILLYMFYTHDNPTVPEKKEFIAFQEKSTCDAVQQFLIQKTLKLLRDYPDIKKRGKFKISKCLPSLGSYGEFKE